MLRPKVTATRDARSLNGMWRFKVDWDNNGIDNNWAGARLDGTREIAVPGSVNDLFADENVRNHVGYWFYQRDVQVPATWSDQQILVRFGSVTHSAVVFAGDVELARFKGGYMPFEVDVTEHVTPGEKFRLTVAVDNRLDNTSIPPGEVVSLPDGRRHQEYMHDFYNYTGIHRTVELIARAHTHVEDVLITTDYSGSTGTVNFDVRVAGSADSVKIEVVDLRDDNVVATAEGATGSVDIPDVNLWTPGVGGLYGLKISLIDASGALVDEYTENFGVRTVEVKDSQFLINDKPFYFTGFGMHEDHETLGKGHSDAHVLQDMELLSWIGANSLRTSHYPYSEEWMDYCDAHGIVVIDETPAVGLNLGVAGGIMGGSVKTTFTPETVNDETQAQHKLEIERLVARDKNRPAVVLWSIANEPESETPEAREYFAPLVEATRAADPTRPVGFVNIMLAPYDKCQISDLFDVIMLNRYYGWYFQTGDIANAEAAMMEETRGWIDKYPGKPIIYTEFGADTVAGMHSIYNQPWTEDYQIEYHKMNARVFDAFDEVIGEQMWNFADFQTKFGIMRVDGNKKGAFTRDRRPKGAARFLRERWTTLEAAAYGRRDITTE